MLLWALCLNYQSSIKPESRQPKLWGSFISWRHVLQDSMPTGGTWAANNLQVVHSKAPNHMSWLPQLTSSTIAWLLPPVVGFSKSDLLNLRNLIPSWLNGSFISDTHEAGLRFWRCVGNSNLPLLSIFLEWSPREGIGTLDAKSRQTMKKGISLYLLCWEHSSNDFRCRNSVFINSRNKSKQLIAAQILGCMFGDLLSLYKCFLCLSGIRSK